MFSTNLVNELTIDVYNTILLQLSYIDILATMFVCKTHYEYVDKNILTPTNVIQRYMNKHNLQYDNFLARLTETCVIYGGFVYNVIMDYFDSSSDIDILHFSKNVSYDPAKSITVKRGWNNDIIVTYDCETIHFKLGYTIIKEDGSSSDGILYQHVNLAHSTSSLNNYFDNACDFDISKSYITHDMSRFQIKNLYKYFNRQDDILQNKFYKSSFSHTSHSRKWTIDWYIDYCEHLNLRLERYRKKGITFSGSLVDSRKYYQKLISNYNIEENAFDEYIDLNIFTNIFTRLKYLDLASELNTSNDQLVYLYNFCHRDCDWAGWECANTDDVANEGW